MANLELDPVFVRAIRLLHSKSKDSSDQLRQMLEDAIAQRHGGQRSTAVGIRKDLISKLEPVAKSRSSSPSPLLRTGGEESNKRNLDKLRDELSELNHLGAKEPKWMKRGLSPKTVVASKSHSPSSASSLSVDSDSFGRKSDDSDSNEDDLAKEIMMGLNCVVCKRLEVGPRNQLVECQECHSLYHQECHMPVIPQEYNDPRVVWYCANCTKTMKKQATKLTKPVVSSSSSSASVSTTSSSSTKQKNRESPVPTKASLKLDSSSLFKRESKNASSSSSSGSTANSPSKPLGMAALAASLKGGHNNISLPTTTPKVPSTNNGKVNQSGKPGKAFGGSSKSGSSSSSSSFKSSQSNNSKNTSSTSGSSTASILNADKRLQIMKKKAAKMQEKKKLAK